jgi:hypothetical protein
MRNEFAKWEIKTSVFSGRKSQAGNCCCGANVSFYTIRFTSTGRAFGSD